MMIDNKAYRLIWLEEDTQLIVVRSNGLMRIYKRYEDEKSIFHDTLWLEDCYKEIKIIMKSGHHSNIKYYYALLADENGTHSIIELISKEAILSEFQFNHLKIVHKEIEPVPFLTPEVVDVIFRIFVRKKKMYGLYSLRKGFVFGPYKYETIEIHNYGVILDDKYAIDNDGFVMDITEYDRNGYDLYISKDKKKYLLFLDQKEGMLYPMTKDDYDENIMIAETDHEIFKYDITTGECKCEFKRNDYEVDLSKYGDIAYEGYSKLELGLED